MSDAGDDIIPVEAPVAVEVTAEAPKGKLSVEEALQVQFFFLFLVVQSLIFLLTHTHSKY